MANLLDSLGELFGEDDNDSEVPLKDRMRTLDGSSTRAHVVVDEELWEEMKKSIMDLHKEDLFVGKEKEAQDTAVVRAQFDLMMREKATEIMEKELEVRRKMAAQMEHEVDLLSRWDKLMEKRESMKDILMEDEDLQAAVEKRAQMVARTKDERASFPNFPEMPSKYALANEAMSAAQYGAPPEPPGPAGVPAGYRPAGQAVMYPAGPPVTQPGPHPGVPAGGQPVMIVPAPEPSRQEAKQKKEKKSKGQEDFDPFAGAQSGSKADVVPRDSRSS